MSAPSDASAARPRATVTFAGSAAACARPESGRSGERLRPSAGARPCLLNPLPHEDEPLPQEQ